MTDQQHNTSWSWKGLSTPARAALVLTILSYVVSLRTTTISGADCSSQDFGALLFGIGAVGAGIAALAGAGNLSTQSNPTAARVVGAAAVLFGVVSVLRGVGMIGGPC